MSYQKPRKGLNKNQKNIILTGLMLALLITLSGTAFIIFLNGSSSSTPQTTQNATGQRAGTPTATATTSTYVAKTPTPTIPANITFTLSAAIVVPTTTISANNGWQQSYFRYSESIAFSPSNPSIGYLCGSYTPLTSSNGQIYVGATQNGGANWSIYLTPIQQSMCVISVDPLKPNDVALQTNSCSLGCSSDTPIDYSLYRSVNGGREWTQLSVSGNTSFTQVFAWAGSNLYTTLNGNTVNLYVSINGGVLQSVNIAALVKSVSQSANLYITSIVNFNTTVYVNFFMANCSPNTANCTYLAKSSDNGQTWVGIAYPNNTQGLSLSGIDPATGTLYALDQQNAQNGSIPFYKSTDGGKTWLALPDPPNQVLLSQNIFLVSENEIIILSSNRNSQYLDIYNFQTQKWSTTPAADNLSALTDIQYTANSSKITLWGLLIAQNTEQLTYLVLS